jgi:hypothetical protein
MPADDPPRRRLDALSPSTRLVLALVGIVLGLGLLFVGARSCETSLSEPTPTTVPGGIPAPGVGD